MEKENMVSEPFHVPARVYARLRLEQIAAAYWWSFALPVAVQLVFAWVHHSWELALTSFLTLCVLYPPAVAVVWFSLLTNRRAVCDAQLHTIDYSEYPLRLTLHYLTPEEHPLPSETLTLSAFPPLQWHGYTVYRLLDSRTLLLVPTPVTDTFPRQR